MALVSSGSCFSSSIASAVGRMSSLTLRPSDGDREDSKDNKMKGGPPAHRKGIATSSRRSVGRRGAGMSKPLADGCEIHTRFQKGHRSAVAHAVPARSTLQCCLELANQQIP